MVEDNENVERANVGSAVEVRATFTAEVSIPTAKDFKDASASSQAQSGLPKEFGNTNDFQIVDASQNGGRGADKTQAEKPESTDQKTSPDDKSVRGLDKPDYSKMTPEQQAKEAKEIAKEISEKGLTDRAARDHLRSVMLQAYLGGDKNSQGDTKAVNDLIKQVNQNLPKDQQLKLAQPANDQDYKKFLETAQAAINKNPGMQMGMHGQVQLVKQGADGKEELIGKTHFAAMVKKAK